ncbi:MAG: DUF1425 domain-containing protein [Planctomycetota bacterium]
MAPNTAAPDPLPASAYPQIVLHGGLEQEIVKERPVVTAAQPTVPMSVRVPLRSVIDGHRVLQYRFVFFDASGGIVSDNPVYRTVSFPPRTRRFIEAQAISLEAVDWELEVRPRL